MAKPDSNLQFHLPSPQRAVIYSRVSTDRQEEEGTSLDSQVDEAMAYALKNNMCVVETFREVYTGSLYRQRPLLTKLREMAHNKEFDVMIIRTFDRLSRNQIHLGVLIDEMQELGIKIDCMKEEYDDSTKGQFMRSALAFVAQVEREKIAERTDTGRRKRIAAGKLMPGWKPRYGYSWDGERKERYIIKETEAENVRRIFHLYVYENGTCRGIANKFNAEGISSPSGKGYWHDSAIHDTLVDPMYTGKGTSFKYNTTSKIHLGKMYKIVKPFNEQLPLPDGVVPAIITQELFDLAQEKLARSKREAPRNNKSDIEHYLLRCGFIRCGYCKRVMTAGNSGGSPHAKEYRCGHRYKPGYPCAESPTITTKVIDRAVWEYVGEILRDFTLVEKAIQLLRNGKMGSPDLRLIETTIRNVQTQQDNLAADLMKLEHDGAPKLKGRARDLVLDELARVEDYLVQLEKERQRVLIGHLKQKEMEAEIDKFVAWCLNARESYETATYEEKRRALRMLGIQVYAYTASDTSHNRYEIQVAVPSIVSRIS